MVASINQQILADLSNQEVDRITEYFADEDTYIRKAGYQAIGKIYKTEHHLRASILDTLRMLLKSGRNKIRQTCINAAGEIGTIDFAMVEEFFNQGLYDPHHSVRNAVIGSIKKMGQKNPQPTLKWAQQYLHHPDKEIRREICHGIELRGRTHPHDILPMLKLLQNDPTSRVRNTLIHVLGQISYKKGCLVTVIEALNGWENRELVLKALDEIVDVHRRYQKFAALTPDQVISYIDQNWHS